MQYLNLKESCFEVKEMVIVVPLFSYTTVYKALSHVIIAVTLLVLQAPGSPGVYEARYYPSYLDSDNTCLRHPLYLAAAKFSRDCLGTSRVQLAVFSPDFSPYNLCNFLCSFELFDPNMLWTSKMVQRRQCGSHSFSL